MRAILLWALIIVIAGILAHWLIPDNLSPHGLAVIVVCATVLIFAYVDDSTNTTAANLSRIQDASITNLLDFHNDLAQRLDKLEAKEEG